MLLLLAQVCPAQLPVSQPSQNIAVKIPDATPLQIATTNTIDSADVKVGDIVSFRVLKAVKIDGLTVIEEGALATGRVLKAHRGRPFGKAGQLAWELREVVAANGQIVPLAFAETRKGQSKGGTVATAAIVTGVLLAPIAPVALLWGFKRGKSAVLPAGTVLQALTRGDSTLTFKTTR